MAGCIDELLNSWRLSIQAFPVACRLPHCWKGHTSVFQLCIITSFYFFYCTVQIVGKRSYPGQKSLYLLICLVNHCN